MTPHSGAITLFSLKANFGTKFILASLIMHFQMQLFFSLLIIFDGLDIEHFKLNNGRCPA